MIEKVRTSKGAEAITSDQWHVVHSRFAGPQRERPYERSVHSEHADRAQCVEAAKALLARLAGEAGAVSVAERDEVFVRRPGYRSLKTARCRKRKAD